MRRKTRRIFLAELKRREKYLVISYSPWREYVNGVSDLNRCYVNRIDYYLTSREAK